MPRPTKQEQVRHALREIFEAPGMVQTSVALAAGQVSERISEVNAGQLSAWINHDKPLRRDKIAAVIMVVIDRVRELGLHFPEQLRLLEQYQPYQHLVADTATSVLDGPISHRHPRYVDRAADEEIVDLLELRRWVSILGGPKMGKSSLLQRIERQLADHTVIRVDFADYVSVDSSERLPFWSWLGHECESKIGGRKSLRLRTMSAFPEWFSINLVQRAESGHLWVLFDHIDLLHEQSVRDGQGNALEELAQGLHALLRDAIHERCSCVFAYDEAHQGLQNPASHASVVLNRADLVNLDCFAEADVERLLLQQSVPSKELDNAIEEIWDGQHGVRGHPLLTQAWLQALGTDGADAAMERAWETIVTLIRDRWSKVYIQSLWESERLGPSRREILVNSGLFRFTREEGVEVSTSWIAEHLDRDRLIFPH